jgi:hypothetical protein
MAFSLLGVKRIVTSKPRLTFLVFASICVLGPGAWLGAQWRPYQNAMDFEECSQRAERAASSAESGNALRNQCDQQFVGRRKMGGGYTYYDFLQNRQFDIAGPNPTPDELKYFDQQYTLYLESQRRDAVEAALAEKQSRTEQSDLDLQRRDAIAAAFAEKQSRPEQSVPIDDRGGSSKPPLGAPRVLAPTSVPIPKPRNSVVRLAVPCDDVSVSCGWEKFSAGIEKFFGSMAGINRP